MLSQVLLRRVDQTVSAVAEFNQLTALLIFRCMRLGILDHLFDIFVAETA